MDYLAESNLSIGQRMRHVRRKAHMTQEQLADILGVSVNYLGEVERGRKPLSLALASQFCQHFDVTYDYLYRGTASSPPDQIRERSVYEAGHTFLHEQINSCSPDEIHILSKIIGSYLDASRQLKRQHAPKDHTHGYDHTAP